MTDQERPRPQMDPNRLPPPPPPPPPQMDPDGLPPPSRQQSQSTHPSFLSHRRLEQRADVVPTRRECEPDVGLFWDYETAPLPEEAADTTATVVSPFEAAGLFRSALSCFGRVVDRRVYIESGRGGSGGDVDVDVGLALCGFDIIRSPSLPSSSLGGRSRNEKGEDREGLGAGGDGDKDVDKGSTVGAWRRSTVDAKLVADVMAFAWDRSLATVATSANEGDANSESGADAPGNDEAGADTDAPGNDEAGEARERGAQCRGPTPSRPVTRSVAVVLVTGNAAHAHVLAKLRDRDVKTVVVMGGETHWSTAAAAVLAENADVALRLEEDVVGIRGAGVGSVGMADGNDSAAAVAAAVWSKDCGRDAGHDGGGDSCCGDEATSSSMRKSRDDASFASADQSWGTKGKGGREGARGNDDSDRYVFLKNLPRRADIDEVVRHIELKLNSPGCVEWASLQEPSSLEKWEFAHVAFSDGRIGAEMIRRSVDGDELVYRGRVVEAFRDSKVPTRAYFNTLHQSLRYERESSGRKNEGTTTTPSMRKSRDDASFVSADQNRGSQVKGGRGIARGENDSDRYVFLKNLPRDADISDVVRHIELDLDSPKCIEWAYLQKSSFMAKWEFAHVAFSDGRVGAEMVRRSAHGNGLVYRGRVVEAFRDSKVPTRAFLDNLHQSLRYERESSGSGCEGTTTPSMMKSIDDASIASADRSWGSKVAGGGGSAQGENDSDRYVFLKNLPCGADIGDVVHSIELELNSPKCIEWAAVDKSSSEVDWEFAHVAFWDGRVGAEMVRRSAHGNGLVYRGRVVEAFRDSKVPTRAYFNTLHQSLRYERKSSGGGGCDETNDPETPNMPACNFTSLFLKSYANANADTDTDTGVFSLCSLLEQECRERKSEKSLWGWTAESTIAAAFYKHFIGCNATKEQRQRLFHSARYRAVDRGLVELGRRRLGTVADGCGSSIMVLASPSEGGSDSGSFSKERYVRLTKWGERLLETGSYADGRLSAHGSTGGTSSGAYFGLDRQRGASCEAEPRNTSLLPESDADAEVVGFCRILQQVCRVCESAEQLRRWAAEGTVGIAFHKLIKWRVASKERRRELFRSARDRAVDRGLAELGRRHLDVDDDGCGLSIVVLGSPSEDNGGGERLSGEQYLRLTKGGERLLQTYSYADGRDRPATCGSISGGSSADSLGSDRRRGTSLVAEPTNPSFFTKSDSSADVVDFCRILQRTCRDCGAEELMRGWTVESAFACAFYDHVKGRVASKERQRDLFKSARYSAMNRGLAELGRRNLDVDDDGRGSSIVVLASPTDRKGGKGRLSGEQYLRLTERGKHLLETHSYADGCGRPAMHGSTDGRYPAASLGSDSLRDAPRETGQAETASLSSSPSPSPSHASTTASAIEVATFCHVLREEEGDRKGGAPSWRRWMKESNIATAFYRHIEGRVESMVQRRELFKSLRAIALEWGLAERGRSRLGANGKDGGESSIVNVTGLPDGGGRERWGLSKVAYLRLTERGDLLLETLSASDARPAKDSLPPPGIDAASYVGGAEAATATECNDWALDRIEACGGDRSDGIGSDGIKSEENKEPMATAGSFDSDYQRVVDLVGSCVGESTYDDANESHMMDQNYGTEESNINTTDPFGEIAFDMVP